MSDASFEHEIAETIACDVCGLSVRPEDAATDGHDRYACSDCQTHCESCTTAWAVEQTYLGYLCSTCVDDTASCNWCGELHWYDAMLSWHGGYYCSSCYDGRCCECGEQFGCDGGVCEDCVSYYEQSEEYQEDFDYDVESFDVREFAQVRGPMKVSYELEFARNPEDLARRLYNAGLSDSPEMGDYNSGVAASVKYDGSVDGGGELVGSKFVLPRQEDTNRFWRVFEVLRSSVKEGNHALDMRCGLHIHVDATNLPLTTVMSTAVAFNYLEDILYRLSAANWRYHRTNSGNDYAKVAQKDIDSKERFRHMFGDRYLGLNLSNYLSNRYSCACGAGFDRADLCSCQKRKMTIEYRLFNTTANHIKMHGYTAIACALVAFGKDKELLASDLPPMEFTHSNPLEVDLPKYVERLRWMFEVLPFSAEERESLRYLIRNSDLGPLLREHKDDSVIRGILEDDNDLRIPVFIAVRQDDMVLESPPVRRTVPPIGPDTPRNDYDEYIYLRPGIDQPCSTRNCNSCWQRYPYDQVQEYQRRLPQTGEVEVQLDAANNSLPPVDNTLGCGCTDCRQSRARQAGFHGYYVDSNGRWRTYDGRFAPTPLTDTPRNEDTLVSSGQAVQNSVLIDF